jgi:hypothetical protein
MDDKVPVYDLGEVRDASRERRTTRPPVVSSPLGPKTDTTRVAPPRRAAKAVRPPVLLSTSLSLLVPGSGHALQRRYVSGAVWAASFFGLAGALLGAWQILPRLWAAASALGLPPHAAVWLLGTLCVGVAAVHGISALAARTHVALGPSGAAHPLLASGASLVIPGWGQLLNGHLLRGGLFLFAAWTIVLSWLVASTPVQEMLIVYQLYLPEPLGTLSSETFRWALPAALWPLAVYDAWVGAVAQRSSRIR